MMEGVQCNQLASGGWPVSHNPSLGKDAVYQGLDIGFILGGVHTQK